MNCVTSTDIYTFDTIYCLLAASYPIKSSLNNLQDLWKTKWLDLEKPCSAYDILLVLYEFPDVSVRFYDPMFGKIEKLWRISHNVRLSLIFLILNGHRHNLIQNDQKFEKFRIENTYDENNFVIENDVNFYEDFLSKLLYRVFPKDFTSVVNAFMEDITPFMYY